MRIPPRPYPAGLWQVKERIAEIKARFRRPDHAVRGRLQTRAAAPPGSDVSQAITSAAARHGLDPAVLRALAEVESGLRFDAVSPDGALGLMQLMPATARRLGVTAPFDIRANVDAGARYLKEQLVHFGGDLVSALAAYNAGPAAVERYGGLPPYAETRTFVMRVLDLAKAYSSSSQPTPSP